MKRKTHKKYKSEVLQRIGIGAKDIGSKIKNAFTIKKAQASDSPIQRVDQASKEFDDETQTAIRENPQQGYSYGTPGSRAQLQARQDAQTDRYNEKIKNIGDDTITKLYSVPHHTLPPYSDKEMADFEKLYPNAPHDKNKRIKEYKKKLMKPGELYNQFHMKKKNWIANAIKKPGALHKQLGVKAGNKIPVKSLTKAVSKGGVEGKRARLAQTLKSFHHKRNKK